MVTAFAILAMFSHLVLCDFILNFFREIWFLYNCEKSDSCKIVKNLIRVQLWKIWFLYNCPILLHFLFQFCRRVARGEGRGRQVLLHCQYSTWYCPAPKSLLPNLARCFNQKYSFPILKLALPAQISIFPVEDVSRHIDLQHISFSSCFPVYQAGSVFNFKFIFWFPDRLICNICFPVCHPSQQAGSVTPPTGHWLSNLFTTLGLDFEQDIVTLLLIHLRESEVEIFSGWGHAKLWLEGEFLGQSW